MQDGKEGSNIPSRPRRLIIPQVIPGRDGRADDRPSRPAPRLDGGFGAVFARQLDGERTARALFIHIVFVRFQLLVACFNVVQLCLDMSAPR